MSRNVLGFFLIVFGLEAQTSVNLTGPASARPGSTISVNLNAAGATNTGAAAAQWQLGYPTGGYTATVAAGATLTAAGKSLSCSADNSFCVGYGLNATVIGNGIAAVYSLKVPTGAAAGGVTVGLSGVVLASPTGSAVPVTLGVPYSLVILDYRDLNGDGKVDASDLQLMVGQVVAAQSNPAACVNDVNGDGRCDVLDIVVILLKMLGGQ